MNRDSKTKSNKRILAVIIILFIVIVSLFSNTAFIDRLKSTFNNKNNMTLRSEGNINIDLLDDDLYKVYDNKIVVQQGRKLICYDLEGNIVWQRNIFAENPLVHLGNNSIVIGNEDGLIKAIGLENEDLWQFDCKQPIEYIYGHYDRVVIFTIPSEKMNQVLILDNNGQLLTNITTENEAILLYNISNNKKYFAISTVDLTNMSNKIKLYSSKGFLIWDRLFEDQFINSIDFIEKDGILVTTDQSVLFFDYKNQLIWKRNIKGLLKYTLIGSHRNNISILYNDKVNYLETIDLNGRTKQKISLDEDYNKIYSYNASKIFLVGDRDILGVYDDKIFLKYRSDTGINDFALSNNKLLIFTSKGIDIMRISDS